MGLSAPAPDAPNCPPEYLTAAQVGAMLQLSAKSVYRLAKADSTLPQLKLMGTVRFPKARLMKWLRSREGAPIRRPRVLRRPSNIESLPSSDIST